MGIFLYNFETSNWELIKPFSDNRTGSMEISNIEYLNKFNSKSTTIHFAFFTSNLRKDYNANIDLSCEGYYWKEITEFEYSETLNFDAELYIDINVSTEYKEKEIIVTSLIEIHQYYCFGSWSFKNSTIMNHIITIRDQTFRFDIETDVDLRGWNSFFGWRRLEIEITKMDEDQGVLETSMHFRHLFT